MVGRTLFCKKTPVPLIPGVVFCDRQVEENPMGTSWPRFTWKNHFYTNIVVYSVALCIHLCTMHKRAMCYVAGRMSLMNILKTCSCSHQLTVPHICHSTYGTCTFTGPTVWNSLSDTLHSSAVGLDHFQRDLTDFANNAWEVFCVYLLFTITVLTAGFQVSVV